MTYRDKASYSYIDIDTEIDIFVHYYYQICTHAFILRIPVCSTCSFPRALGHFYVQIDADM